MVGNAPGAVANYIDANNLISANPGTKKADDEIVSINHVFLELIELFLQEFSLNFIFEMLDSILKFSFVESFGYGHMPEQTNTCSTPRRK